jgi:hypothetical protein
MTLCIAAECKHDEKWAIVHCFDSRQEKGGVFQELIGSEDAAKIVDGGGPNSYALLAGMANRAIDLVIHCRKAVSEFLASPGKEDSDLEMSILLQELRKVTAERKRELIEHYLLMNIGMTLKDFTTNAAKKFTLDHYNELWREIRNLDLGAEVILTNFHGDYNQSNIIRIDRHGQTHWRMVIQFWASEQTSLWLLCANEIMRYTGLL